MDNYLLQAKQAREAFLGYDQEALIRKCGLASDEDYLYVTLMGQDHRIHRRTGDISYREEGVWRDGNTHPRVMTLLDLVCDSREDRHLSGRKKNMQAFGLQFHQNLLEDQRDPMALAIQDRPEAFRRACEALEGRPCPTGDICCEIPLFEDLAVTVQFWLGDEEFAPRLRYLWDENALQYLKYETMYFAVDLLMQRIADCMKKSR